MQKEQEDYPKTFLQATLEKTSWQDIYDEHYGKYEVEKELPKGRELQEHFYTNSNKRWVKWRLKD